MKHHVEIPSSHRPCSHDIAELRKSLAFWQNPKVSGTKRAKHCINILNRQIAEAEKELQTHEEHI